MFIVIKRQKSEDLVLNINEIKLIRKRELNKNPHDGSPITPKYFVDIFHNDPIWNITEEFSDKIIRDTYYEDILQKLKIV